MIATGSNETRPKPRRAAGWVFPLVCGLLALGGGCADRELETSYGRQQRPLNTASVNGTDVLAGMFSRAGHEVISRRTLITSDMQSVHTIVWFPDDFAAPDADVCKWFDAWLSGRAGRTLIYVGRDFDAAPLYWQKMAPLAPQDQQAAFRAHASQAAFQAGAHAEADEDELVCDWFKIESGSRRDVRELAGPWSKGIQAAQTEIEVRSKLVPLGSTRRLLTSVDDVLVARNDRLRWNQSQLILVDNGSFLLNLPLVNHEHRKLAGRLIEAAGPAGKVVFLESGPGGPPVDPLRSDNSLWKVFGAWPLNAVLLHFAVLGIIFCFARWPIFGRPRVPPAESTSDFVHHVDAIGELLRRTKDRKYALGKLAEIENMGGARPGPH